ncbi:TonB-dependent receptor [Granulicella sp. dw_53]|uniref:TonB-dependent receptor n=1 Tax=Granulicella sp. dw_53 TaxID=2719792 RepID=UPI001BD34305|nr:TonB-dependent receptor [Granulicella sp. dw_53]
MSFVLIMPVAARFMKTVRLALVVAVLMFGCGVFARAVIVRGTVTDPLGAVVRGARIQLIQGGKEVSHGFAGADGTFEVRSGTQGRFVLLTSALSFTPGVSADFYGGRTDVVTHNVTLSVATVTTAVSVTATGIPTPIQQVSSAISLVPMADLSTRVGVVDELRQSLGVAVVQTGQTGGVTSLFVRGGSSTANKVLIDGISANDVGGVFDFGTVSSTGLTGIEMYRGANSALYGTDAGASVVNFVTPRGNSERPVLNYSGDAGNFHTWRNEVALSGAHKRLDYYGAYSRFDTSNALQRDRYHSSTSVANLGYNFTTNTQGRFTLRDGVSGTGLPSAHDFYGISSDGKQADQDLYSGLTLENRLGGNWHNLVRYGIARKREQQHAFTNVGTPITFDFGDGSPFTLYYGNVVTIRGANGYTATGRASFFLPEQDSDSNRDELYYQSDYTFPWHITALFGFRYQNERGSFVSAFSSEKIQRTNFQYTLQFQGEIKNRFFYSLGGDVEKNHLYGITGTPRIGLSYVPVRPGRKYFRGTKIRANVATGVQEPTLALEFASLYRQLLSIGDTADIARFHVTPPGPQRSRSYDIGVDQNIKGEKLIFKAGYFHNVFDHQLEGVGPGALVQSFGYSPNVANSVFTPYLNSLAFRAQGFETELQYQPFTHVFLRGGYTYLDSVVLRSFSSDAFSNGTASSNPNLPGVAIGAEGPLVGARPFRRPPHTGFFAVQYASPRFSAALKGALASRSDDSTFLDGFDTNLGNSLVLPNRDLAFGYAKLDFNTSLVVSKHFIVFTELGNLLGQQHIGPIGYPGLPMTFRSGLKIRIGGL